VSIFDSAVDGAREDNILSCKRGIKPDTVCGGADNVIACNGVLGDYNDGWFAQVSNGAAGFGDTVSGGLTAQVRQALGCDDVVDKNSAQYGTGTTLGNETNTVLLFANPAGGAATVLKIGSMAGNFIEAAKAASHGEPAQALILAGSAALHVGTACKRTSQLAKGAVRVVQTLGAGEAINKGVSQLKSSAPLTMP
jgi:hypothetical protein